MGGARTSLGSAEKDLEEVNPVQETARAPAQGGQASLGAAVAHRRHLGDTEEEASGQGRQGSPGNLGESAANRKEEA